MRDSVILRHLADVLGLNVHLIATDVKDFFNQLKTALADQWKTGLRTLELHRLLLAADARLVAISEA
eukprot:1723909-Pleurochrysis_carterae.AAC.1